MKGPAFSALCLFVNPGGRRREPNDRTAQQCHVHLAFSQRISVKKNGGQQHNQQTQVGDWFQYFHIILVMAASRKLSARRLVFREADFESYTVCFFFCNILLNNRYNAPQVSQAGKVTKDKNTFPKAEIE